MLSARARIDRVGRGVVSADFGVALGEVLPTLLRPRLRKAADWKPTSVDEATSGVETLPFESPGAVRLQLLDLKTLLVCARWIGPGVRDTSGAPREGRCQLLTDDAVVNSEDTLVVSSA